MFDVYISNDYIVVEIYLLYLLDSYQVLWRISDIVLVEDTYGGTEPVHEKHSKQPQSLYRIGFSSSNRCNIIKSSAFRKYISQYEIILK